MAYEDLLKDTSVADSSGNFFLVTITDLDISKTYPIQFRWKKSDQTFGPWSVVRAITTPGESTPNKPSNLSVSAGAGLMTVTWDGKDSSGNNLINFKQIDIYIDGAPFDGTKPADSFTKAGTKTIAAPAGTYLLTSYAVSTMGASSLLSTTQTVTVTAATKPVLSPEDPYAPTVSSGLASVIVEWNGKKSNGSGGFTDFTDGSFAGAKIFIGETSNFTPSDNNWVHTLNFGNGSNKVSIGVGTVINKTTGAKLLYGTDYYIKLDTINANGVANNDPVSASNNPVSVSKLPASEISTGTLTADNSITAGVEDGQRVVISGSSAPFIIYGTDGTTKLLEYVTSGTQGSLAIKGSGTFTGDISAATGTLSNALNVGTAVGGLYPFSVSSSGVIRAVSGTIGGWTLGTSYLQNSAGTFQLNSDTSTLAIGPSGGKHIRLSASGGIATYDNGTQVSGFNLSTSGTLTLSGEISASDIYIGASGANNYIKSDGSYKFGGATTYISGTASKITLGIGGATDSTGGIYIGVENIEGLVDGDSQFGDTTLAISRSNGYVVRGRAFFYGGAYQPQNPKDTGDSSSENQAEFLAYANPGDMWMSRVLA